jgi:hypothetical protein
LIVFFCLVQSGFSQKAISIEKVIINYGHGENYHGKRGSYEIQEIIQFNRMPNAGNVYDLYQYLRINSDLDHINPPCIDTLLLKPQNTQAIKGELFDELINTLSSSEDNFTEQFVRPYLNKPTVRDIITMAKQNHFESLYSASSIEENSKDRCGRIGEIQSYVKLDSFLAKELENTKYNLFVTEAYHHMIIRVVTANDTITYRSDFFGHPLRQPFVLMDRNGAYTKKETINLNINLSLMKILPENSVLREKMDFNSISEDYIKWYLKRYCNYAVK